MTDFNLFQLYHFQQCIITRLISREHAGYTAPTLNRTPKIPSSVAEFHNHITLTILMTSALFNICLYPTTKTMYRTKRTFKKSSLGGIFIFFEWSIWISSRLSFTPHRVAALITCRNVCISWFVLKFSFVFPICPWSTCREGEFIILISLFTGFVGGFTK